MQMVLRKLESSQERLRLKKLLCESREKAKKKGFSEREIQELIEKTRKMAE
jgi:hypothetical protein